MKPRPAPEAAVPAAMAVISARSCPEVKAVPRPVSTTAPTDSSWSASSGAWVTSTYMAESNALRASGRLNTMTRTPPESSSMSMRLTRVSFRSRQPMGTNHRVDDCRSVTIPTVPHAGPRTERTPSPPGGRRQRRSSARKWKSDGPGRQRRVD
jgi:hypothetical protein